MIAAPFRVADFFIFGSIAGKPIEQRRCQQEMSVTLGI
jgi:hypothetical protein